MRRHETYHFSPREASLSVRNTETKEQANQIDIFGFSEEVLRSAPYTQLDAQIIEPSRDELRRVRHLVTAFLSPQDPRYAPLSLKDSLLSAVRDLRRPATFFVMSTPDTSAVSARVSLIQPRAIKEEMILTKPTKNSLENITRAFGVLNEHEGFDTLLQAYDSVVKSHHQDPNNPRLELAAATFLPSSRLLLQPKLGKIDLLVTEEGLAPSFTGR